MHSSHIFAFAYQIHSIRTAHPTIVSSISRGRHWENGIISLCLELFCEFRSFCCEDLHTSSVPSAKNERDILWYTYISMAPNHQADTCYSVVNMCLSAISEEFLWVENIQFEACLPAPCFSWRWKATWTFAPLQNRSILSLKWINDSEAIFYL